MANSIRFILPGSESDLVSFPSATYPRRIDKGIGEDLLDYLYPYPLQDKNDPNLAGYQIRQKSESHFEKLTNGSIIPRSGATGPSDARVATPIYTARVADYENKYYEKCVTVYQRPWCATHASSERPLIATSGLALCVFVLIYDPVSRIAAAAHIDEDQESESMVNMIPKVFPGDSPLDIYFVGGSPSYGSMERGSRKNLTGQLNGLFSYREKVNRDLTIRMFDVLGRTHHKDITFDTRDAQMITNWWGAPSDIMGQPLDSLFRYWPNGQYWAEPDGSGLAVETNKLVAAGRVGNKALTDYLATVRCQWDGSPSGWDSFYKESNELICRLTIEYAFSAAKVAFPGESDAREALILRLKELNIPMRLEQSFKRWCKWIDMTPEQQKEAGKAAVGSSTRKLKTRAEESLTWAVVGMLKDSNGVFAKPTKEKIFREFEKMLPVWVAKGAFAVSWEGRH